MDTVEIPLDIPSKIRVPYEIRAGEGMSSIGTHLGIRESSLQELKQSGSIRAGDVFHLEIKPDGTGILVRNRGRNKKDTPLTREAIYQDIEKGPAEFPHVKFLRVASSNTYKMVGGNDRNIGNIEIPTANIDQFKKRLSEISGRVVTECSARKGQYDLACSFQPDINHGPNAFSVNSKHWYDFFPSNIDLTPLSKLTTTKDIKGEELLKALALSLPLEK